ncbi:hypothetical protein D3C72_1200850 [compost metagenome]
MLEAQGARIGVAAVVGVHEHVRARLDLGVHAAAHVELHAAAAAARYHLALHARHRQLRQHGAGAFGGLRGGVAAGRPVAQMLDAAVVRLQAAQGQAGMGGNPFCQGDGRRRVGHAAAALADIDLDKDVQLRAGGLGGCRQGVNL